MRTEEYIAPVSSLDEYSFRLAMIWRGETRAKLIPLLGEGANKIFLASESLEEWIIQAAELESQLNIKLLK